MHSASSFSIAPKSQMRRRICFAAAGIVLIALVALAARWWLNRRIPGPDASAGRIGRYMASPPFAALPHAQKEPYEQAFRQADAKGQVTQEQRQAVLANLAPPKHGPINKYFSLPPGKAREQFLDQVIDNQERLKKEMKTTPNDGAPKGLKFQGRAFAESIPPEDRAQMDQFMQDLHDRRVARGLPDDGRVLFTQKN